MYTIQTHILTIRLDETIGMTHITHTGGTITIEFSKYIIMLDFKKFLEIMKKTMRDEEIRNAFKVFDKDNNDRIEITKIQSVMESLEQVPWNEPITHFDVFKTSSD